MRLLHYSAKPFEFDRNHVYEQAGSFKPHGFWVSVEGDDDWLQWCHSERWNLESFQCAYEITLAPNANVLHVSTVGEFDAFHRRYQTSDGFYGRLCNIDWPKVKADYDGLIIAPYRWERRLEMDFMWYYSWDCASGAIWNLNAVADVKRLDFTQPAQTETVEETP